MVPTFYYEENRGVLLERLFYLISNLQHESNLNNEFTMKDKLKTFIEITKILGTIAAIIVTCITEYEKYNKRIEDSKKIQDV